MGKVLTVEQSVGIVKQLKRAGKKIVLVGGVFDLLHRGHVEFLEKSKKEGDCLMIFLESDKKTQETKGRKRPINNQEDRAFVLSKLNMVDFVLKLPYLEKDEEYEKLVKRLQPAIIAVTKGDSLIELKRKYARAVGGKLVEVISRIKNYSTSKLSSRSKAK
jgi:rfaE bifunctional protein nucleotidyltransferase chain/domain